MKHRPHPGSNSQAVAYLLVTHGSRDPRPDQAIRQLAHRVVEQILAQPPPAEAAAGTAPLVETAQIELAAEPLHRQIQHFGDRARSLGIRQVAIVPLFLLPGVHVREDVPREVALAQQIIGAEIALHLTPYLGSHPAMADYLYQCLHDSPRGDDQQKTLPQSAIGRIMMAHGSRRPGGNRPVEAIAHQLGAEPAYWFMPPHLADQVQTLVARGCREIRIMPYFLFAGGITDAIAETVAQMASQSPGVTIRLHDPLGPTPAIAKMVGDLMTQPQVPASAMLIP